MKKNVVKTMLSLTMAASMVLERLLLFMQQRNRQQKPQSYSRNYGVRYGVYPLHPILHIKV